MAPVVHGLENKYGQQLTFNYLDIDDPDTKALQEQLGYNYGWRPFIFFVNGQGEIVGNSYIGYQNPDVLETAIQDFLVEQGVFAQ